MSTQSLLTNVRIDQAKLYGPLAGFQGFALGISTPEPPPQPAPPIVQENLVAYYDAGNPSSYTGSPTTWFDLSPLGNNATFNETSYASDNNGCIVFDGIASYVETPALIGTGTAIFSQSICVWVSPNDTDGNIVMVQNPAGNWNMPPITADTSRFRGKYWSNPYIFSSIYTNNEWYYVCIVFNYATSQQILYVNGVQIDIVNSASYNSSGVDNLFYLGRSNSGSDNMGFFAGRIAILQVYSNKALSGTEIQQNFNADKARFGY